MHFEILVEDVSGKAALEKLVPKIISPDHTWTIHPYKGIGRIPQDLQPKSDANKRILLDQLPRLIRGYGNTFANYPQEYRAVLIIICDLDDRCLHIFRQELLELLNRCSVSPETYFCIAIEEGEAWYLGDRSAIKEAYPEARDRVLDTYVYDSICGTWELLADALVDGGSRQLSRQGWQEIGRAKSTWATDITPHTPRAIAPQTLRFLRSPRILRMLTYSFGRRSNAWLDLKQNHSKSGAVMLNPQNECLAGPPQRAENYKRIHSSPCSPSLSW
jgi:hypothetical protein